MTGLFRIYYAGHDQFDKDGYPVAWGTIKHMVRDEAGNRCVRCGHPYTKGDGEWSRCDAVCFVNDRHEFGEPHTRLRYEYEGESGEAIEIVEARWRILTVHHLNGVKADCRWWNLLPLCQRCHLTIQGKVDLERAFILEHTSWFKVYAAGWYAEKYEGRSITRDEATARVDELLAYERLA